MAYCVRCGEKVDDTAVTCPACGAVIPGKETAQGDGYTYGSAGTQEDGYTYGSAGTQGGGYTYGDAGAQGGGYTYGSAGTQGGGQSTYHTYYGGEDREGYFPESEVRRNKVMAVLCYMGLLVFIPVFAGDGQSEYLKLHKNQGIVLFVAETCLNIIERYLGWGAGIFSWFTAGLSDIEVIARFIIVLFVVMGIVYAYKGCRKELPGIGKIKIFK